MFTLIGILPLLYRKVVFVLQRYCPLENIFDNAKYYTYKRRQAAQKYAAYSLERARKKHRRACEAAPAYNAQTADIFVREHLLFFDVSQQFIQKMYRNIGGNGEKQNDKRVPQSRDSAPENVLAQQPIPRRSRTRNAKTNTKHPKTYFA
jgi:hypothetical protein